MLDAAVAAPPTAQGLERVGLVPMYAVDGLVRRSRSLQATADGMDVAVRMNSAEANAKGLSEAERVRVRQGNGSATLDLVIDDSVPAGCAWVPAGVAETIELGASFGPVEIEQL